MHTLQPAVISHSWPRVNQCSVPVHVESKCTAAVNPYAYGLQHLLSSQHYWNWLSSAAHSSMQQRTQTSQEDAAALA
jgi:hypothetical protein